MKKRRDRNGFTLVETLVCVLIIALLSAVTLTGIRTAWSTHENALFESESEILASTLNTAIGDILHYSNYEQVDGQGTEQIVYITNQNYGILRGTLMQKNGKLYVKVGRNASASEVALVNDGAYTNITVSDFSMEYRNWEGGDNAFHGSYTLNGRGGQTKQITFAFRPVNPDSENDM